MTNNQKSRWIVENILQECWHYFSKPSLSQFSICTRCKKEYKYEVDINPDFYTSDSDQQAINFFKLWRAIEKGEGAFLRLLNDLTVADEFGFEGLRIGLISCPVLADVIGNYFNWGEVK